MTTLTFKIEIKAPKEKVWEILWGDKTYQEWTSVFCEGTYAESNWQEGGSIHFLSPDGSGMNSVIVKRVENEYMAFKHLSEIKNFKVMPVDKTAQGWADAKETYRLIPAENGTILEGNMDVLEKYIDYFKDTFPKAFEKVKELSENK